MEDNFKKLEIEILDALYKRDCNGEIDLHIKEEMFLLKGDAEPCQEVGYYLDKLKRDNYVDFRESSIRRNGDYDNRYRCNASLIWWDDIHLTYKGKSFISEYRLSRMDKVRRSVKKFFVDILNEFRARIVSHIVSFLLGVIISYSYYLWFIK